MLASRLAHVAISLQRSCMSCFWSRSCASVWLDFAVPLALQQLQDVAADFRFSVLVQSVYVALGLGFV